MSSPSEAQWFTHVDSGNLMLRDLRSFAEECGVSITISTSQADDATAAVRATLN